MGWSDGKGAFAMVFPFPDTIDHEGTLTLARSFAQDDGFGISSTMTEYEVLCENGM
jgi:hypothetical protein